MATAVRRFPVENSPAAREIGRDIHERGRVASFDVAQKLVAAGLGVAMPPVIALSDARREAVAVHPLAGQDADDRRQAGTIAGEQAAVRHASRNGVGSFAGLSLAGRPVVSLRPRETHIGRMTVNNETIMDSDPSPAPARMPTIFIPHGAGPCFFMDWDPPHSWDRMAAFLSGLIPSLPTRPRAIVLVSAHWLEPAFTVGSHPGPELIYDYYGFPPHTYEIRYPAPGDPALSDRLVRLVGEAGLDARTDAERGLDHGVFIPLKLVAPDPDIPVVPLSLRQDLDPSAHLAIGHAIESLRDEGILIVGSGMSFHNMRGYGDPRFTDASAEFDKWLTAAVAETGEARDALLRDWATAPHARLCHPPAAEEHLLPLLIAAGAGAGSPGRKVFSDQVLETTISAFRFG